VTADARTVGQRWRASRDLVIYAASRKGGLPFALIADAMDLTKSRIQAICKAMDAAAGQLGDDQAEG